MAAPLAKLLVEIGASTARLEKDLAGARRDLAKWGDNVSRIAKSAAMAFGGIFAVGQIKQFGAEVVRLAQIQEQAERKVRSVIQATGQAAGYSLADVKNLAAELQQLTTFGDEAILGAQSVLLTFRNIRGAEFRDATEAALDMATILGGDLKSSVLQLGKALNDPIQGISALSRAGVTFTEEQKNLIRTLQESGRMADAQRVILAELNAQMGGAAQAEVNSYEGAVKQLSNAWGDFKEVLGESVTKNDHMIDSLKNAKGWVEGLITSVATARASALTLEQEQLTALQNQLKGGAWKLGIGALWRDREKELEEVEARLSKVRARIGALLAADVPEDPWMKSARGPAMDTGPSTDPMVGKIQKVIEALTLERDQIGRTATEQKIHTALRQAGIDQAHGQAAAIRSLVKEIQSLTEAEAAQRAEREADLAAGKSMTDPWEMHFRDRWEIDSRAAEAFRVLREQEVQEAIKAGEKMTGLWESLAADREETETRAIQMILDAEKSAASERRSALDTAITGWASGFSATMADAVMGAKASFDEILRSFVKMLTQMVIQKSVVEPLLGFMGFGPAAPAATPAASARGNVFSGGQLMAFAGGGVVGRRTLFPMASGMGLMGESGAEAILPLKRGPSGRLGVESRGGGGGLIQHIHNHSGAEIRTEERMAPDGRMIQDVIIGTAARDVAQGGQLWQAMAQAGGLRRAGRVS